MDEKNEVSEFLVKNGYPNLVEDFKTNKITTMLALAALDPDDLVTHLGCSPIVANKLLKLVKNPNQNIENNAPVNNGQLIVIPPEIQWQIEKKDLHHTNELKVAQMETDYKLKMMEMKMEHMKEMFDQKILVSEATHKAESAQSKTDNNQWNPAWGPWNPSWGNWNPSWAPWINSFPFPSDSILLNPYFYQMIQSWLPSPRQWSLLYRANRDGWTSANFHGRCNNSGATITLIRSNNNFLFGGYNPNNWTSAGAYQSGAGSFIFTLTNSWNKPPTVFRWKSGNGPYDNSSYHATFGGGHDLHICSNSHNTNSSYSSFPNSYDDTLGHGSNTFAGSSKFLNSEIEVFRIV